MKKSRSVPKAEFFQIFSKAKEVNFCSTLWRCTSAYNCTNVFLLKLLDFSLQLAYCVGIINDQYHCKLNYTWTKHDSHVLRIYMPIYPFACLFTMQLFCLSRFLIPIRLSPNWKFIFKRALLHLIQGCLPSYQWIFSFCIQPRDEANCYWSWLLSLI